MLFLFRSDVENYSDYQSLLRRTKEHMDSYSTEGLRTLCLAKRVLTLEQYRCGSDISVKQGRKSQAVG